MSWCFRGCCSCTCRGDPRLRAQVFLRDQRSDGGKEPQHANFATRATEAVGNRLVQPLAISMAVTGRGLILVKGRTPSTRGNGGLRRHRDLRDRDHVTRWRYRIGTSRGSSA